MTPVFPLCLLDPEGQARSAQSGVSGGGGGRLGPVWAWHLGGKDSRPTQEFFCPPFHGCEGEGKKGVKSSTHMAPLFTIMKEGGHYPSLGSLGDTLPCH